jgi:hypothetical protein
VAEIQKIPRKKTGLKLDLPFKKGLVQIPPKKNSAQMP